MSTTINTIISEKKALKATLLLKQNYYAQYHLTRQLTEVTNLINQTNIDILQLEQALEGNNTVITLKNIKP